MWMKTFGVIGFILLGLAGPGMADSLNDLVEDNQSFRALAEQVPASELATTLCDDEVSGQAGRLRSLVLSEELRLAAHQCRHQRDGFILDLLSEAYLDLAMTKDRLSHACADDTEAVIAHLDPLLENLAVLEYLKQDDRTLVMAVSCSDRIVP